MPIKNFTDSVQPRFPRLGKLRKGGERVNNGYGPDLDHFRFTSDNPEIIEAFVDAYGEQPRSVQVYLPYATPDEAFTTWCEVWSATGLVHRCDGETMSIWLEGDKYARGAKKCTGGHEKNDPLNDAIGRLDVIIPELVEAGYVGYVTLETHSKNDILSILAVLRQVYDSRASNPLGLRGILFNLRRVQESISTPGFGKQTGKRSRVDKWLVKIEPAADWVRLQLDMAHSAQMLPLAGDTISLPSGLKAEAITGEIIEEADEQPTTTPSNGASLAAEASKPITAKPGNGKKPAGMAAQIDELGVKLWPGLWDTRKKTIEANYTANGKVNQPAVLKFLEDRRASIKIPDELRKHVEKSWPGKDILVTLIKLDGVDPLDFLHVLANGVAQKLDGDILLQFVETELQIPSDFREPEAQHEPDL